MHCSSVMGIRILSLTLAPPIINLIQKKFQLEKFNLDGQLELVFLDLGLHLDAKREFADPGSTPV